MIKILLVFALSSGTAIAADHVKPVHASPTADCRFAGTVCDDYVARLTSQLVAKQRPGRVCTVDADGTEEICTASHGGTVDVTVAEGSCMTREDALAEQIYRLGNTTEACDANIRSAACTNDVLAFATHYMYVAERNADTRRVVCSQ